MKTICAWCGCTIADEPHQAAVATYPVTHGICALCRERLGNTKQPRSLEQYLNRLEQPVMVIDDASNVIFANTYATAFLNKKPEQIIGFKGGDVMECAYASLPGGCGQTEHCVACTIRHNVRATFVTGVALHRVPAYLDRGSGEDLTRHHFLISTEKMGITVLLKIDEVL